MTLPFFIEGQSQIPAGEMNSLVVLVKQLVEERFSAQGFFNPSVVEVHNVTSTLRKPGDIVGLGDSYRDPTNNEIAFRTSIVIDVDTPDIDLHVGMFGVMLTGMPGNGFGQAAVYGAATCRVNMNNADDKYADILDDDATQLDSTPAGTARIQWVESGTGEKWAIVILGDTGARTIELTAAPAGGTVTVKATDSNADVQGGEVTLTVLP